MDYIRYYLGTLFMVAGVVGFALGGMFVWLGAATFLLALILDLFALRPDYSQRLVARPRVAEIPLYLHVVLVPILVVAAAWRVHRDDVVLTLAECAGIVITLGWLGVLPNVPVAHEFLHRHDKLSRFVAFVCTSLIADPLRRLAHVRSHHVKLGLAADSDTAHRGESIYSFMIRAAIGGSRESFQIERVRLEKQGRSVWSIRSDVVHSLMSTALILGLIYALAGLHAVLVLFTGFVLARFLLESFNYLQHYGLVRVEGEKFQRRHSWSHLTPVVRAVAFEITNHAHHHEDMQVPFYRLVPDPNAPQMPSALLCFLAALVPPVWERLIAIPKLRHWDLHFATDAERVLAMRANRDAGWPLWVPMAATSTKAVDVGLVE